MRGYSETVCPFTRAPKSDLSPCGELRGLIPWAHTGSRPLTVIRLGWIPLDRILG